MAAALLLRPLDFSGLECRRIDSRKCLQIGDYYAADLWYTVNHREVRRE